MDLVVAALRTELAAGRWDVRLPGTRVLAQHLGASAPTVAAALARLAADGLLQGGGARRAYRVVGGRCALPDPRTAATPKRLLLLTHEDLGQLPELSRSLLELLRDRAASKGWLVDSQVVDFVHVKHLQRSWDQKIRVDAGTSIIALYGRPPLAEWAIRRQLRIFFLGGSLDGLPVPMVAVKSSQMAVTALAKLTAQGHWRIIIPLCDRTESFKVGMRQATQAAIEAAGHTYSQAYHNPESPFLKPDVTWRILEAAFAKTPPTAMVFLDWRELVTAQCFLARLELTIPADVSVILLSTSVDAEWFYPPLSCFRFPIRRLLATTLRWLEDGAGDAHPITLPHDFVEGATIGPARTSRVDDSPVLIHGKRSTISARTQCP